MSGLAPSYTFRKLLSVTLHLQNLFHHCTYSEPMPSSKLWWAKLTSKTMSEKTLLPAKRRNIRTIVQQRVLYAVQTPLIPRLPELIQ